MAMTFRFSDKAEQWLRIAGINLSVLLVSCLIVELIFGSIFFGTNYGLLVVDRNVSRKFDTTDRYAGGGIIEYRRDEHGLRGRYADLSKIDILTIGGSTTNEILVDEGKTWSDQLAKFFSRAGRPIVVVNGGVDGQSTVGHLKVFELWFPKIPNFRPRYVLAYIGINDLSHLINNLAPNKWEVMTEQNKTVKQYLKNNSAIYGLYRTIKGMVRARNAMLVHSTRNEIFEWREPAVQPDLLAAEKKLAPYLDAYAERIQILMARIRDLGAKPIIVTQHTGHYRLVPGRVLGRVLKEPRKDPWTGKIVEAGSIDIGPYAALMVHNQRAMETCRDEGGICIDVFHDLVLGPDDFYDLVHTTPNGSKKIAKFLFEKLNRQI